MPDSAGPYKFFEIECAHSLQRHARRCHEQSSADGKGASGDTCQAAIDVRCATVPSSTCAIGMGSRLVRQRDCQTAWRKRPMCLQLDGTLSGARQCR